MRKLIPIIKQWYENYDWWMNKTNPSDLSFGWALMHNISTMFRLYVRIIVFFISLVLWFTLIHWIFLFDVNQNYQLLKLIIDFGIPLTIFFAWIKTRFFTYNSKLKNI